MTKLSPVLTLEEYLAGIRALLREWPRECLETWILDQARSCSPRDRRRFLADLGREGQGSAPASRLPGSVDLLERIDDFLEELQAGAHYREPDWGDDEWEDSPEGDEDWADTWDEFLKEARLACLKGDWDLGAAAYGKLLGAFALQEEDGVFGEEIAPENILESDLAGATLLYLRAVYETVPEDSRAASVLAAMEDLYLHPPDATLAALGATGPGAMEGFQDFVRDLASLLESRGPEVSSGWDGYRDWLPEALMISRGKEGLKDFLVRNEYRHAQACRQHLRQALGNQAWEEALHTARTASKVLEDPRQRTWMLDAAAYAAERAGLQEESADFRHTIWRYEPGEFHLLAWLGSCPGATWKQQLSKEVGRLAEPLERFPTSGEELWALLRDPWSELADSLLTAKRPQHWDREARRGFLILAVAALEGATPPPATLLAQAWFDAQRPEPEPWGRRDDLIPEPEPRLGLQDLLAWKMETSPLGAAEKARLRDALRDASRRWCHQILKEADRPAYLEAARLMGFAAESLMLDGRTEEGWRHLQDVLAAFPRHRAFAKEMATLRSESNLLNAH